MQELNHFIDNYTPSSDKPPRKKRCLMTVDDSLRCLALIEDQQQCPRKKATKKDVCTIHKKGTPFGIVQGNNGHQNRMLFLETLQGIEYYVDECNRIYSMEAILNRNPNPPVIGTKEMDPVTNEYFCLFLKDAATAPASSSAPPKLVIL